MKHRFAVLTLVLIAFVLIVSAKAGLPVKRADESLRTRFEKKRMSKLSSYAIIVIKTFC